MTVFRFFDANGNLTAPDHPSNCYAVKYILPTFEGTWYRIADGKIDFDNPHPAIPEPVRKRLAESMDRMFRSIDPRRVAPNPGMERARDD